MVDPALDVTYGPHPVQKTAGTITVPPALLREIGMVKGESAHWMLNPDIPGTLVLVPAAMLARAVPELVRALRTLGA